MNLLHAAALPLLLLTPLASGAQPAVASAGNGQDPKPYGISVNVDLVVLHPTVLDRRGRFVSDLREGDFDVREDGVRQSIQVFRHEDVPVTVGLVIDHSGSMRPKLSEVMVAARTFARLSNAQDQMFVVNFNGYVTMGLPPAKALPIAPTNSSPRSCVRPPLAKRLSTTR